MALYAFHRVLIAVAILFDFMFTVFCIRKYNRTGDGWELVWAGASSLLTLGMVFYLVYFSRNLARLRLALAAREMHCPQCEYDLRGSLAANAAVCPECGAPITDEFRRKAQTA